MAEEDLKVELERLRAENEALKKPSRGQISIRVSEKGGVSVYGLGRFPVTLYKEQWDKLLANRCRPDQEFHSGERFSAQEERGLTVRRLT